MRFVVIRLFCVAALLGLAACGGGGGGGGISPQPEPPPATTMTTAPPPSPTSTVSFNLGSPAALGAALAGAALAEYENSAAGHANNGLAGINAMGAYRRGYFGQGVTVGVIDTDFLTTHAELSANMVAGKRADAQGNLHDDIDSNYATDYGTFVAGIIAAAQNGEGMMGVAPRAKIMPLQFDFSGNEISGGGIELAPLFYPLFRHAADSRVHIVNNSWTAATPTTLFLGGEELATRRINLPPAFALSVYGEAAAAGLAQMTGIAAAADMVWVWTAGYEGWNSETGLLTFDNYDENGLYAPVVSTPKQLIASATIAVNGLTLALRDLPGMGENMLAGGYAGAPLAPGGEALAGKWLNVVALNAAGNAVASWSNGCGASKYWCVAAPGERIRSADSLNNNDYSTSSGAGAAHASGALAVLKSRWQHLPMNVILAILLHSTDDLGEKGVDDVYGQGKINLSLAVSREGGFTIVTAPTPTVAPPPALPTPTVSPPITVAPPTTGIDLGSPAPLGAALTGYALDEYNYSADSYFNNGLAGINAMGAYQRGYFGQGVTVGVMDSDLLTSHFELSANIVAGKRVDRYGDLHDDITSNYYTDYGTFVAGIIAAAQNGDNMMGVAPRAKIMPLQYSTYYNDDHLLALLRHAANMQVPIVKTRAFASTLSSLFLTQITTIVATANMVFVWQEGDNRHFTGNEALAGKWLNVVALNKNSDIIASWSENCGASKHWCVAAPGENIRSTDSANNADFSSYNTEAAAAHASGALAILKSRWQHLPMDVILAIMLHSTDDLGDAGVDDVYGQGRINLSLAAAREGDFNLVINPTVTVSPPPAPTATVSPPIPTPTVSLPTNTFYLGSPAPLGAALTGDALAEYNYSAAGYSNNGLAGINAMGAYRRGYFGRGVTVGVVDTGVLTTHNDLAANIVEGRRADPSGNLYSRINDADGHGTHVAGIVAAAQNGEGMMGVAPQAKIMPLQMGHPNRENDLSGNAIALFQHAANMRVPIVNNSWGRVFPTDLLFEGEVVYQTRDIQLPSPFLRSLNHLTRILPDMTLAATANMVFVWATHNHGWNSETGRVCIQRDIENYCLRYRSPAELIAAASVRINGQTYPLRNIAGMGENMVNAGYQGAPLMTGGDFLLGKWLNVVALNEAGDAIASFSNGCGASKHFCVAAPGSSIRSAYKNGDNSYKTLRGTSMAAPHAAGALAVLKSRWQQLPMHVILAIMLHSTDDLGATGVDDVYGQGKINLSLAASREGVFNIETGQFTVLPPTLSFNLGSPAFLGAELTGTARFEYFNSANGYTSNSGLAGIKAMGAYQRGYFGQGVTVAVADTGVLTTHNDLSANIVAGKRADAQGNLYDGINDISGHGTHVAGIVAGVQNGEGMMGVAPRAKIMPLQMGDPNSGSFVGDPIPLFRHAANMSAQIVNNSWSDYFRADLLLNGQEYDTTNIQLPIPFLGSLNYMSQILPDMNFAATANMVFVWSAGNKGWNSQTGRVCINSGCSSRPSPAYLINSASVRIGGQIYNLRDIVGIGENMVNFGYQGAPLLEGGDFLLGKWLNVVALDTTGNAIASSSNGCGASRHFCVAAPGRSIRSADKDSNSDYRVRSGTSMAAPHAAGALAVLKSRWQQLPMHVILAIMLHSTDDLGATGVDDVYGQGKINLSLAASREGVFNIETGQFTVSTQPPQTGNFVETRIELSPLLAGLQPQLAGMSVATRFLGRYYQNINFGGFVAAAPAASLPAKASDNAAAALLLPAAKAPLLPGLHLAMAGGKPLALHYENARAFARAELCHACAGDVWQEFSAAAAAPAPAFANSPRRGVAGIKLGNWRLYAAAGADEDGKNAAYTQTGAGWELKRKAYSFHADLYATQENKTFLGGKFAGAAAIGGGSLRGARLQAAATLPAGWRGFALAEGGVAAARFVAGSGIVGGKPARLAAFKLGASKNNLWHGGDNLRLGLQYHPRIVSGNLQTRFGVATDAVIKDERTQMEFHHQTAMQETSLSLKSARVVSAHIGYSRPLQRGGQLALALQHAMQEGKNQTALALQYQAAF